MKDKLVLFLLAVFAIPAVAQVPKPSPLLYDNFGGQYLNLDRWMSGDACNGRSMECVREISSGKLRLAHRLFGRLGTDSDIEWGWNTLLFANPAGVKSITYDVEVTKIEEIACPTNSAGYGGVVALHTVFFNAGDRNSADDDLGVQFGIGRRTSDPAGELTVYAQVMQGSNYFGYTPLGTTQLQTPLTVTVTWDQSNSQFLVSWTNKTTHVTTKGVMPYSATPVPAVNPVKLFYVSNSPANCGLVQTWSYTEAKFDNVLLTR